MQLDTVKLTIPLKKKFRVAKGEAVAKTNIFTILNNRYNGEASSSVQYGPSIELIEKDIIQGVELIKEIDEITFDTLEYVSSFEINPISKSALVGMIINYLSGESRKYPWEVLGVGTPVGVKSSYTISIDTPAKMIEDINNSEFPIIKIKMGNEEDVMILDLLDSLEGKDIRVDANGGWSCAKAEEMIFNLSQKGVKVIEQPTSVEFISEWKYLKGKNDVCLVMDEGMNTLEDYKKFSDNFDCANIKMEKSGGVIEGLKIALAAQADKKKIMLGCMVSSSIGIAQSLYISSKADYFDLDGPSILENDIATGIKYSNESILVDREIIGGPKIKREIFEKYITK